MRPMPLDLFDVIVRERIAARRRVVNIARRIRRNELRIGRNAAAVAKVNELEWELELACRDLVALVDDSPPRTRPKGWAKDPDGETA